jgi:hypothetical protein
MVSGKLTELLAKYGPPCSDVTRLLSESLDRPLSVRERLKVRVHYFICVWCERYGKQLHFLRTAVRSNPERMADQSAPEPGSLTPAARNRIKERLRQ